MKRLAIIVGHTNIKKGATLTKPFVLSEYEYNKVLANIIKALALGLSELTVEIFLRDGRGIRRTYKAVEAWRADAAIELHYNSYTGPAYGSLTMYGNVKGSRELAELVQARMNKTLGNRDRGLMFAGPKDRGGVNVNGGNVPKVLIEPFFGSYEADAVKGLTKIHTLAKSLLSASVEFLFA